MHGDYVLQLMVSASTIIFKRNLKQLPLLLLALHHFLPSLSSLRLSITVARKEESQERKKTAKLLMVGIPIDMHLQSLSYRTGQRKKGVDSLMISRQKQKQISWDKATLSLTKIFLLEEHTMLKNLTTWLNPLIQLLMECL